MKYLRIALAGVLSLGLLAGCGSAGKQTTTSKTTSAGTGEQKLQVYSSFYVMTDFVQKIGGEKVDVKSLVPNGVEPHDWEPEATDMAALEKADVLVYNGAGMEHWVEKVTAALSNTDLTLIEASAGVELLAGEHHHHDDEHHEDKHHEDEHHEDEHHEDEHHEDEHHEDEHRDHDHDHDHGDTDPHVWLDPKNAKKELENIKNGLIKVDAANKEYYEANYKEWAEKFDALDQKFSTDLAAYQGSSIVTAHEAFGYLCHAYGLKQVGIEDLSPDSEPDPQRMQEVIKFVKEHQVSTIFFEELVSPKVAESIAAETGAKTAMLNPIESAPEKGDYVSVMEENLAALKAALSK